MPPDGYVGLGTVAYPSYAKPPLDYIRCVHRSCVTYAQTVPESDGKCIWTDRVYYIFILIF